MRSHRTAALVQLEVALPAADMPQVAGTEEPLSRQAVEAETVECQKIVMRLRHGTRRKNRSTLERVAKDVWV